MKLSDRSLTEHIRLLTPLFGIITAVFVLRLIVGISDPPGWLLSLISLSLIVPVTIVLMAVMIHSRRFGGYPSVVFSTFLLVAWSQILIVLAIIFTLMTGMENIYTVPEFSIQGEDPYFSRHIFGHLTFGIGLETIFGSILGSLVLYMMRRTSPRKDI